MKIVDAFMFNHELDLLEVRLRLYQGYVDEFVIFEADHSLTNKPKKLYFEEHKERFSFCNKIRHVVHRGPWEGVKHDLDVETFQRNILFCQASLDLEDDDILLLSDIDEFWPIDYDLSSVKDSSVFHQDLYYYNMRGFRGRLWEGTMIVPSPNKLTVSAGELRKRRHDLTHIRGGWHLSFFMTPEQIREKLQTYAHHYYNKEPFINIDYIRECIRDNKNLLDKADWKDEALEVPGYLMKELERFSVFV